MTNGLTITPTGIHNLGTWTRGFIEAPQTGPYTFWIASTDEGQLWLSTNESPANLVELADNPLPITYGSYLPVNQSPKVSLVAGKKYYFEMYQKNGNDAPHAEVGWQLPDGSYEAVISPNHIWPYPVDRTNPSYPAVSVAPTLLTDYSDSNAGTDTQVANMPSSISVLSGQPLDLLNTCEASQPATVSWYSNNVLVANANLLNYHISGIGPGQNGDTYTVVVSNSLGVASNSMTLSVTVDTAPPVLVDALVLGNPAGDISVVFDKGIDPVTGGNAGNYSLNNGATVTSAVIGSDNATVLLRVSGLTVGTSYNLSVNNVNDLSGNTIAANSSVPVEANLNTAYRFDETSGSVANDFSGNGNNGTLAGGVQPGFTGKVLRSYKFDGASGHVAMPSGYANFQSGLTVAVWARPTSSLVTWARIMDLGNGSSSDNIIFARNGTSPNLTFETRLSPPAGATTGQVTASNALYLSQWQHIAATLDSSGNVTIYRNGVVVQTGVQTSLPNIITRTNCYVARSDWSTDSYYQGEYDDFRLYNRILSSNAILALASGGGPDDSGGVPEVSVVATTPITAERSTPPGVFTVTRTGSTNGSLAVQYTLSGTATNGVNYTNLSGSVTIPAGASTAQVLIGPINLSFSDLSRTAILTLSGSTNYTMALANSDTVTIQNNDVVPVAYVATADNAKSTQPNTTVDVWFGAAVTLPSATNLSNYALSGGLTVTSATLDTSHNLRVILGVSTPVPTNTILSVSGVLDAAGNGASTNITIRVGLPSCDVVALVFHQGRSTGFTSVTDGVVNNVNNVPTAGRTGFDTYNGAGTVQFGGMIYQSPVDIQAIKVDLGQQFSDGGDWGSQPHVYILKNPKDTDSTQPQVDTNDWVQVPAVLISGSSPFLISGTLPNPSPNTPYVYDLSGLTPAQRSGYGWAVGGVQASGAHAFMSFSELRAYGVASTNYPTVSFALQPVNATVTAGQRAIFSSRLNMSNLMATVLYPPGNDAGVNVPIVGYQWYMDGSAVTGATNATYTTDQTTTAETGNQYYLVASNHFFSITSSTVTLTVNARTSPPVVVAATVDLYANIDVWFDEPVDPGTSQNLGNYALNDPALTLQSVTQNSYQTRAALTYTGTQSVSNLTLTVSGVADTFGNTLGSQTVPLIPQDWPVQNLVANAYQQGRAAMLTTVTDGQVVIHTAATFAGGSMGQTHFAGLIYNQPQVFGVVKVDLGNQFADGGDWAFQPNVYILKQSIDPNSSRPESTPSVNGAPAWVQVPATLISGNTYSWEIDGPVNSLEVNGPTAFDLSHLPASQRTGYGWAVGGVVPNALGSAYTGITPAAEFLSLSELRGFGVTPSAVTGAPQVLEDIPSTLAYPEGLPLALSVLVGGTQPISYQWKRNGTNLTDGGRISGSQTSALNIAEVLAADAGTYQLFMTNTSGTASSTASALSITRIALNNGAGWVQNGAGGTTDTYGPPISGNVLALTDGLTGETRSAWLNAPQYIGAFQASYTYQDMGGGGADGAAFVMQNSTSGTTALGGGGGALGYNGITPSAALEFNIYSGNTNGYAFRTNGATGIPYNRTGALRVDSGDPIGVSLNYNGTVLTMTLTDAVAQVSFATNLPVNIPAIVGSNSAYVGFTGASGGVASTQKISNFVFASLPQLSIQPASGNNYLFTWPQTAGGFVLLQNSNLSTTNWTAVNIPLVVTNGQNQVTVPVQPGTEFYRLRLP
ncbi:MAG TPA: LamG-like jellyroll fold domain-containing protein [Verrucomicrobiae bacterium]|nr:LamG-like jellyroll fold domain-containing protein [Verrucomicrobiae bacterium]